MKKFFTWFGISNVLLFIILAATSFVSGITEHHAISFYAAVGLMVPLLGIGLTWLVLEGSEGV